MGGGRKPEKSEQIFVTCVGGVQCVVVGCVGLRKMMCRRFVAWCEHFGSARARAPKGSIQHLRGARARARTQTSDEDRPKRAALIHLTEHKTRLS